MKIGLITMHRVKNYGSILQTFATQYVFKQYGYDTEVIDYYPERQRFWGMLKGLKNKNGLLKKSFIMRTIIRIIMLPTYLARFIVYNRFMKKGYIVLSKDTYKTAEELKENLPKYDIYCTGSDQVWNSIWNEKLDRPFYLDFVKNNAPRFAYSASFGREKLEEWEMQETKELLSKYSAISVRENSGLKILSDLGIGENAIQVLDPTLLLKKEDWENLISDKYKDKQFVLMYNINRSKELDKYAKEFAKRKGLKLINLSYSLHDIFKAGKLVANPQVEDFLSLFAYAEFVLTDSFHATSFSINFNKQFLVYYPKRFSARISSILEITNLESRVINGKENDFTLADIKIDFSYTNKILDEKREESRNFIKEVLREAKEIISPIHSFSSQLNLANSHSQGEVIL